MKKILIGLLLVAIVVAGCKKETTPLNDTVSIEEIATQESLRPKLEARYGIDRSGYGDGIYKGQKFKVIDLFKELPPIPDNFYRYKYLIMNSKIAPDTLCGLTPDYYTQPEFYADNWVDIGLNIYKNPDPNHWTPEGYGTFPHQMETLVSPGTSQIVCTFFHASWAVETYQGFSLHAVYLSNVEIGGGKVGVDSETAKKYITVDITPKEILVEPAYFIFKEGWAKQVKLNISISPDTPSGMYAIGFDVGRASIESAKNWTDQYGENYQQKGFISVSEPQFIMAIKVR